MPALLVGCSGDDDTAQSQIVQLAVAADFTATAERLGDDFTARTGIVVVATSGASGELASQISAGAAFDVFLSADTQFPQELVDDGFAVPEPVVYAVGTLGLYSQDRDLSVDGEALLAAGAFASLAIADPTMAPYGMAAIQTLESLGLLDQLESTLVFGNNVAEALDLVETGAADAGFVAFPDLDADQMAGAWLVPADLHAPIDQAAVQLTAAPDPDAAAEWLSYLVSEAAGSIIEDAGYRLP